MEFTEAKIKEFKKKHPGKELYEITVGDKSCILRSPTRQDLSYATVVKDPIKLNEVLINQLWVAGDEEMRTDDSLFLALSNKLAEVLEVKEASLKKL